MHILQAKDNLTDDNIWFWVWDKVHPSNWEAYLIIAAAGIMFALLIGSRKDVKEILKDVLRYVVVAAVFYFAALGFVYYMMTRQ